MLIIIIIIASSTPLRRMRSSRALAGPRAWFYSTIIMLCHIILYYIASYHII